jgi:hypothetical protein
MPAEPPENAVIRSSLPRYGRVPRLLLRDPDITARAKVLYGLLDDYAGPEGRAFPSRAKIADSLGCSTDTVDRAVRELETRGWLHREVRRRDDRTYDSTLYSLLAGPVETVVEPVDNPVGGGRMGAATGRTGAEGVAAPVRTEGEPREGTTPRTPPKGGKRARPEVADDDPDWSRFWSLYPRKEGKGAARRAWLTAVAKERPDVIIAAVRRFAGTVRDLRYCPHPSTWLNGERWADSTSMEAPGVRRNVSSRDEECPRHVGEFADNCRACASERIAKKEEPA